MAAEVPQLVKDAILASSDPMPPGSEEVRGYDFSNGVDYHALLTSYRTTGFQASNFGKAVEEINNMVSWRSRKQAGFVDDLAYC